MCLSPSYIPTISAFEVVQEYCQTCDDVMQALIVRYNSLLRLEILFYADV